MSRTRNPVLSGTWYPRDPGELTAQIDGFLAGADRRQAPAGRPLIAVIPHAGYMYSGGTAGRVFGLLANMSPPPARVFILCPNHRAALHSVALSSAAAFATPLGAVPVAREVCDRLARNEAFIVDDQAHATEHAVEIQLPLLQRAWPSTGSPGGPEIVPLVVPPLSAAKAAGTAAAIAAELDDRSLIIVSSDFTHYGEAYGYIPFTADVPAALERLDAGAILKILAADAAGLREYGQQTGITMCGLEAAAVALDCGLPAGYEGALLDYCRSGDRDGDYTMSVSYAAVLLCSGPTANQ